MMCCEFGTWGTGDGELCRGWASARPCTVSPGVDVIKLFSLLLTMRPNKQKHLSLETLSSQVVEFEGKARANPI
jgi:hypothetical protein